MTLESHRRSGGETGGEQDWNAEEGQRAGAECVAQTQSTRAGLGQ